jgi:hypothetical protein
VGIYVTTPSFNYAVSTYNQRLNFQKGIQVDYEERITCFIDLIGFGSAINQSLEEDWVRERLYETIHELKSEHLLNETYGNIPVHYFDKERTVKPSKEALNGDLISQYEKAYPITITQFSDSFVISCPSENHASCAKLLQIVYSIHLMYFYNLGMMVRGGISKGKIIHEKDGALFGPAMNEAYHLESKVAKMPRVLFSNDAASHIMGLLKGHSALTPINQNKGGEYFFDLIGLLRRPGLKGVNEAEIETQLLAMEDYVLSSSKKDHCKILYLLEQWRSKVNIADHACKE